MKLSKQLVYLQMKSLRERFNLFSLKLFQGNLFFLLFRSKLERWPSGRRRTPGKCVYAKSVSRVRIPSSLLICPESPMFSGFCFLLGCELGCISFLGVTIIFGYNSISSRCVSCIKLCVAFSNTLIMAVQWSSSFPSLIVLCITPAPSCCAPL